MKKILTLLLVLLTINSFGQIKQPELIYSCKKTINGNSVYDLFNSKGQKIINKSVDWAYSNAWTWLFVVDNKTDLKTVYNYTGEQFGIDSIQESQSTYLNLNLVGLKRNNKWGFYDKSCKLKIPHIYDEVSHFFNSVAAVKVGKDTFMIDTNGIKVDMKFNPKDNNYSFQDDDIAIGVGGEFYHPVFKKISVEGKTGLLDTKNNKVIIPVMYDNLSKLKDKFQLITGYKDKKYGVIAFGGQVIIPVVYESVYLLNDYF